MTQSTHSLMLLVLLNLAGCQAAVMADVEPAVLVEPSAQTLVELQRLVSAALGSEVTLSEQALTDSHLLVIERKRQVIADGTRIQGRDPGVGERFMLVREGKKCLLEYARTGERWPLMGAACIPVASQLEPSD